MKSTYKFQISLLLVLLFTFLSTPKATGPAVRSRGGFCRHPSSRNSCKTCISEQMKYTCPKCVPVLRCMARCLWGGVTQMKCTATCGCDTAAKPSLVECKRCVSRCKCSCAA
ncbi:unnamed protein product [Cochlearia groenlandica]